MKKIVTFLNIMILAVVFTACDLKDNPDKTANFSANIDGVLFRGEATYENSTGDLTYYNITSFDMDDNEKDMNFTLVFWGDTTGTYTLDGGAGPKCSAIYSEDANLVTGHYSAISGQIIVTKIDHLKNTISGTFQFTGNDFQTGNTRDITEGKFTNVPKYILE